MSCYYKLRVYYSPDKEKSMATLYVIDEEGKDWLGCFEKTSENMKKEGINTEEQFVAAAKPQLFQFYERWQAQNGGKKHG